MIQSFADSATRDLYDGVLRARVQRFPAQVRRSALRKLDLLNAADRLADLSSPPGNRLEALKGDLAGFHSIRVNDQWRVVFRWGPAGPDHVSLTDYH